jgi:hypothetical protein
MTECEYLMTYCPTVRTDERLAFRSYRFQEASHRRNYFDADLVIEKEFCKRDFENCPTYQHLKSLGDKK